jgi:hypothetical protein
MLGMKGDAFEEEQGRELEIELQLDLGPVVVKGFDVGDDAFDEDGNLVDLGDGRHCRTVEVHFACSLTDDKEENVSRSREGLGCDS